jgi:hypothetical protein
VYVLMWVFVIRHLNPHRSFVCFFGLFIVRIFLPCLQLFSHSSQAVHPDPRFSRGSSGLTQPWRLRKTGVSTSHNNSSSQLVHLNAFSINISHLSYKKQIP